MSSLRTRFSPRQRRGDSSLEQRDRERFRLFARETDCFCCFILVDTCGQTRCSNIHMNLFPQIQTQPQNTLVTFQTAHLRSAMVLLSATLTRVCSVARVPRVAVDRRWKGQSASLCRDNESSCRAMRLMTIAKPPNYERVKVS